MFFGVNEVFHDRAAVASIRQVVSDNAYQRMSDQGSESYVDVIVHDFKALNDILPCGVLASTRPLIRLRFAVVAWYGVLLRDVGRGAFVVVMDGECAV